MSKQLQSMDENYIDDMAEDYQKRFPGLIDAFESKSLLARAGQKITSANVYGLGYMLEQYESYQNWINESDSAFTLSSLGQIPKIALDVITASFGNSIIPLVASTQPKQKWASCQ